MIDISDIISKCERWTMASKSPLVFYASAGEQGVPVSLAELDVIDVRLASVLDKLTLIGDCNTANAIRQTCALWRDPRPLVSDEQDGSQGSRLYYVERIHAVTGSNVAGDIQVTTIAWGFHTLRDGTPYANGTSRLLDLVFSTDLLEKRYPGCGPRLANGISLGMTPVDIAAYAFSQNTSQPGLALPQLQTTVGAP